MLTVEQNVLQLRKSIGAAQTFFKALDEAEHTPTLADTITAG